MEEGTKICPECGNQLSRTQPEVDSGQEESRKKITIAVAIIIIAVVGALSAWFLLAEEQPVISYAKMAPENATTFSATRGRVIEAQEATTPEHLNIDRKSIKFRARVGYLTIYDGSFNMDTVREGLENANFEKGNYKDMEIWKKDYQWIAFVDAKVIAGGESAVKDVIDTAKGEIDSLYSKNRVRTLLDKVKYSDGIGLNLSPSQQYENLEAYAASRKMLGENAERWDIQAIYLFSNSNFAEASIDQIKGSIENSKDRGNIDYESFQIDRSGNIVEAIVKEFESTY